MPSPAALFRELDARPSAGRTLELLETLARVPLSVEQLAALHERLLFFAAYPRSAPLREFCDRQLAGFARRAQRLSRTRRARLDQSGMAGTAIYYPYDLPMARWLLARCAVEIDWEAYAGRDDDPLREILPMLLGAAAGDAIDDAETATRDLIETARGNHMPSSLAWLVAAWDRAFPSPLAEHLYNNMSLAVVYDLPDTGLSRTGAMDRPPQRLSLWEPAASRAPLDLITEARRPLRFPEPVSEARGRVLLDLVYATLLPRLRELYPATHGNPREVYQIPLERGIQIVVWFMTPEKRLPLEAGWGLLLLRNSVPIGYGAGGMIEGRSEIAINVFDTFRGGEAAWLYSQYARVFYALCGAEWLVTRKYQIGYENEEGLASGAYWFYDKLGFRSVDPEIRALADIERRKIAVQKGYRSQRRTLKKLCEADVALSLRGRPVSFYREFPLTAPGLAALRVSAERKDFSGSEAAALRVLKKSLGVSYHGWTSSERTRFAQMGQMLFAIPDFSRWPARDRARAIELCRLKGSAREADYVRAMTANARLFDALRDLAE